MYIPYGSVDLSAFHLKSTEGDHLDEADSAMDAMRDKLDPAHFRALEHLSGRGSTRGNPPRRKDYHWHALTNERLFRMAFLTTGQWGPPKKELWFHGGPVVPNPRGGRWAWEVPFFTRMTQLHEEIVEQMAHADKQYDLKQVKTHLAEKRLWRTTTSHPDGGSGSLWTGVEARSSRGRRLRP